MKLSLEVKASLTQFRLKLKRIEAAEAEPAAERAKPCFTITSMNSSALKGHNTLTQGEALL